MRFPSDANYFRVAELVKNSKLHTICESARCPNRGECWEKKTATFLIMGENCTRRCGFCAVAKGAPTPLDPAEPEALAEAAATLGLRYAVITSVTRDDLPDGGAAHFVRVIEAVRAKSPGTMVEVLIPDFGGKAEHLRTVLAASPEVLNHNLETVRAIYPRISRPAANYDRSLEVLRQASASGALTKSGLMVGLGESEDDIIATMKDLRQAGVDLLTIGQYLRPALHNPPVERYYEPEVFERLEKAALDMGFKAAASGPLVRSSYQAVLLYRKARGGVQGACAT